MNTFRALWVILIITLLAPSMAFSQCNGQFAAGSLCANSGVTRSPPHGVTASAYLDSVFGTSPGTIIYRGPSGWTSLPGNTSGTKSLTENSSGVPSWSTPSSGTVSSVGLALPNIFTVTGSPVTSTGTLTGSLASQSQNLVFASPDGSSGTPTFRALVSADLPATPITGGNVGPGDIVSGAIGWWGLRAYSLAKRGSPAINVCNASDAVCVDLSTNTTNGALVVTTVGGVDCSTVTTCTVKIIYDQAGSLDLSQATIANRPQFRPICLSGGLPCMVFNGAQQLDHGSPTLTRSQPLTFSTVFHSLSPLPFMPIFNNSNGDTTFLGLNGYAAGFYNTTSLTVGYTGGTWSSMQAVENGSSSVINLNGVSVAGTTDSQGLISTSSFHIGNDSFGDFLTGEVTEVGIWAVAFTPTQQSNINDNQQSFWIGSLPIASSPGYVFVTDFGAKCDGSADDTIAINQAALSLVGKAGTLVFPVGTCNITDTIFIGNPNGGSGGVTSFINLLGAGSQGSVLSWVGANSGVALQFAKNKYFTMDGITVMNNNGVGYFPDNATVFIGIMEGGAGSGSFGTQTLASTFNNVVVNNFSVCLQAGGNDGAASEILYNNLSLINCRVGFQQTDFNSLDHVFVELSMSGNNIGVNTGIGENIAVFGGSSSFQAIDFYIDDDARGVGLYNYRTESAGSFVMGNRIGGAIIVGCRCNNIRSDGTWNPIDATSQVTGYSSIEVFTPTGPTGGDPQPQIRSYSSQSAGKFHIEMIFAGGAQPNLSAFGIASKSHSFATALGGDTSSLGFYGGAVKGNGGATLLSLPYTIANRDLMVLEIDLTAKLAWIKDATQSTTWNNNGAANPATGVGGIDISWLTNGPWFEAAELGAQFHNMTFPLGNSFVVTPSSGFGHWFGFNAIAGGFYDLQVQSAQIAGSITLNKNPGFLVVQNTGLVPVTDSGDFGIPIGILNAGNASGTGHIWLKNNYNIDGGAAENNTPNIGIPDFDGSSVSFLNETTGIYGIAIEPARSIVQMSNATPETIGVDWMTLSHVRQLSEGGIPGAYGSGSTAILGVPTPGQNLRVSGTFATASTVAIAFQRNVSVTIAGNVATATTGTFLPTDYGKRIKIAGQGNNSQADFYGYITGYTDSTHVTVQSAFPQAISQIAAPAVSVIGVDEPDANYLIVGIACDTPEAVGWSSIATSGFTLTSTNATSTAHCNALIAR